MRRSLKHGDVLRDRYQIRERIGQGGAGSIYLANDLRLEGRLCALKEVEYDRGLPEKTRQEAGDQFLREATILARFDHPNLPKVSDFFSSGSRDYLVMDYVPGDDLRAIMLEARRKGEFLSEASVLDWARQLADALAYLHGQQPSVVHRDIKPSNLKITPTGLIKLVDFGLAKIMATEQEMTITVIQGLGTALYTPLEQYGSDESHTDARSDVYSYGATFYHLLTNEPPVDARRRFIEPASLTPPRQLNPSLAPRTEQAILWAMALHPDDRPESMQALSRFLFESGPMRSRSAPGAARPDLHPPLPLRTRSDAILAWAAASLLVLSLVATLIQ